MAKPLGLAPKNLQAGGVEGSYPHALGRLPYQGLHPLPHLGSSLVGEGYGKYLRGPELFGCQQVGNAVGEDSGLARSGTRNNQERTASIEDCLALLGV